MANSVYNFARSTNGHTVVLLAKSFLGMGTHDGALINLGTDDADGETILAQILNYEQGKALDALTMLNRVSQTITMTAGERTTALPNDIRRMAILELCYGPEEERPNVPIRVVHRHEIRMRPEEWYTEELTETWPRFAVLNPNDNMSGGVLEWYGLPDTNHAVKLVYQKKETPFTAEDLSNPESTKYVELPDDLVEILAARVASGIAKRLHGVHDREERWQRLLAYAEEQERYWARQLVTPPVVAASKRLEQAGFANSSGRLGAENFSRRRRRGRGGRY